MSERRQVDLLIVTALTEEAQVVEAVLSRLAPSPTEDVDLTLYEVSREGGTARVATACAHRIGAKAMSAYATSLFERVAPRSAALVGIAAAVDAGEVSLGDVPFASQVLSYDDISIEAGTLTFRTEGIPTDPVMQRAAGRLRTKLTHYTAWQDECLEFIEHVIASVNQLRRQRITAPPEAPERPHLVVETIAGGPFLIRDAAFRDSLRKPTAADSRVAAPVHPKLVSVEMESHGFMYAAHQSGISAMVLKGISDVGDADKARLEKETGGFYRAFACTNATLAAIHLLRLTGNATSAVSGGIGIGVSPQAAGAPPVVVNNAGATIGVQNVAYGAQTIVSAPSGDLDAVLSNIKALLKKGLAKEAGAAIDEADARMWGRMDSPQRARLRALRGWRKAMLGDEAAAARDFHDAHDLNPNDDRALTHKCQALSFQGRMAEAYDEAQKGLEKFPNNEFLRAFLINSAPASSPIEDLLPAHWTTIPLPSIVAVAGGRRIRRHDPALAEAILRRVDKPQREDVEYWQELGTLLVQRIEDAEDAGPGVEPFIRHEAIEALKLAYSGLCGPSSDVPRGQLAFMISQQSKRLGLADERIRWLETARQLNPNDVLVIVARAQDAYERGDHRQATTLLRPVVTEPKRPERSKLVFAHSLLKLQSAESTREALSVLDDMAADATEPAQDRQRAASLLVETQLDHDPGSADASIERHRTALGAYLAEKLSLVAAYEAGRLDDVATIAARMMGARGAYSRDELVDFGTVLGRLRLNDECVQVLEGIAPRTELTSSTTALLNSAMASGRWELVGRICGALRGAGLGSPQVVDAEACVLSQRGDLTGALELVQQSLVTYPEDKRLRLRLSLVAYELGRTDLLPTRADELPDPTDEHPNVAVPIVQILRAANQREEAQRFAYANLKRRRRDVWAWRAMSFAGLPHTPATETEENTKQPVEISAGPGMAVCLKEDSSSKWIQLEKADDLVTAENEYGPTHPITLALSGKKVGDRVELQKSRSGFPARIVEIQTITTCFARACEDCNHFYELQFPQEPWIHSVKIPDTVDELIAMLTAGLQEQNKSEDALLKSYAENPRLSLHGLAKIFDRSIFEMIPFLVSRDTVVHAALSPERMNAARDSFQRSREIIVETTAISTLAMLELLSRAKECFSKLWVARATVDRLRAYIHATISSGASGYVGLDGGQAYITKRDPAFDSQRADYLRKLLASVESWDVFNETERDLLVSASWDAWTQAAGGGTADSVHRSKRLKLALWTDDIMIAAAAEHEGATPISTQAVFEALAKLGLIARDELSAVGARLIGWRYVETRFLPESFLAAAQIAKWDGGARPLVQHMELLTIADWPDQRLLLLLAEVFHLWWNNTLDRKTIDSLVVAALIRLAGRKNSEGLLKHLPVAVHRRFGLDVIGSRHINEVILSWMATRQASIG